MKSFSKACENNKTPILSHLEKWLKNEDIVLEIGSGTGQHIAFFAEHLKSITWQPSDLNPQYDSINAWVAKQKNVLPTIDLDVTHSHWIDQKYHAIYTANTFHIMSWDTVKIFLNVVNQYLFQNGLFIVYGPFNYNGEYTSDSNQQFDQWLKERDSLSGLRDFTEINKIAQSKNLNLLEDNAMPANNRLLVWRYEN